MGLKKKCYTYPEAPEAVAPNPSPDRWTLVELHQHENAYVMKVRYHDCTNFEGTKIMVFRGKYRKRARLDPHFRSEDNSPVARFRPDDTGWRMANDLAERL